MELGFQVWLNLLISFTPLSKAINDLLYEIRIPSLCCARLTLFEFYRQSLDYSFQSLLSHDWLFLIASPLERAKTSSQTNVVGMESENSH